MINWQIHCVFFWFPQDQAVVQGFHCLRDKLRKHQQGKWEKEQERKAANNWATSCPLDIQGTLNTCHRVTAPEGDGSRKPHCLSVWGRRSQERWEGGVHSPVFSVRCTGGWAGFGIQRIPSGKGIQCGDVAFWRLVSVHYSCKGEALGQHHKSCCTVLGPQISVFQFF